MAAGSGSERLPGSTDGVEIALDAIRDDADAANTARRLLDRQRRLIDAQIAQLGRQRWRDVIVTIFGVALLAGVALFVWSGTRASGVVVQPFAVPPGFDARGLSGPVVATHLLDRLTTMQAQTESQRALSSYANNWGDDIKVEVPYAGVSIGELRRYLAAWLGNQTMLSGEVTILPGDRIAVTSRVGSNPPTRSEGAFAELDTLLGRNAEAVYAQTQPYRYSVWLTRNGRPDEGDKVRLALIAGKDENDRLWGYNGMGANAPRYEDRMRYFRAALRVRPDFMPAINNMRIAEGSFGHDEQSFQLLRQLLANEDKLRRDLQPGKELYVLAAARTQQAQLLGDYGAAARGAQSQLGTESTAATLAQVPLGIAGFLALAHDLPAMRQALEEAGLDDPAELAKRESIGGPGESRLATTIALAQEDWPRYRDLTRGLLAAGLTGTRDRIMNDPTNFLRSAAALGEAQVGNIQEAIAVIGPTPRDCQPCTRVRGTILALAGRPDAADRVFRLAIAQSPSLPTAHHDWAAALLMRGDAAGAIAQAQIANRKGANWPEPLRLWGRALAHQRRYRDAEVQYARAAALAPRWGALQLDRASALWLAGNRGAARTMLSEVAFADLSPADRARFDRMTRNSARPREATR